MFNRSSSRQSFCSGVAGLIRLQDSPVPAKRGGWVLPPPNCYHKRSGYASVRTPSKNLFGHSLGKRFKLFVLFPPTEPKKHSFLYFWLKRLCSQGFHRKRKGLSCTICFCFGGLLRQDQRAWSCMRKENESLSLWWWYCTGSCCPLRYIFFTGRVP